MDREALISMAKEVWMAGDVYIGPSHESLEQFAELIRNDYSSKHANLWLRRIDEAVKAEREACAKVLDDMAAQDRHTNYYVVAANAIRARSKK
jgi:hypothetical protein